jgi:hypothetical protein
LRFHAPNASGHGKPKAFARQGPPSFAGEPTRGISLAWCRNVAAGVSSGFGDLALLTGNVPVAFGAKAFAIGFQTAAQRFMFFGIY